MNRHQPLVATSHPTPGHVQQHGCAAPAWRRSGLLAVVLLGLTGVFAQPALAAPYCRVTPPPLAPPATNNPQTTLQADAVTMADGIAVATGNVRVEQKGQALEAPRLRYNRNKATVRADDGAMFFQPGLYLTAATAKVHVDDDSGQFSRANYVLMNSGGRGEAKHVQALGNGEYLLKNATYSTCPGTTKAWLLTATSMNINKQTGRGSAWNSVLHFYGLPVFYLPYMNFPIDDKRHTGFLTPVFGVSSDSGYMLALPYYINLAPNYDATVTPRFLSDRGFQLNGQLRYRTRHHHGEIDGAILPSDSKHNGDDRWFVSYRHTGKLLPHLGVQLRYADVSDNDYFDDLNTYLTRTSHSHLRQSAKLLYANTGVSLSILAEQFQNLNAGDYGPYNRLPQVDLQLQSPTAPFYAGIEAQYTAFESNRDIDAQRVDIRPHVNWAMDAGGWFANAEGALRYTHYRFADEAYSDPTWGIRNTSTDRSIPVFSFGGGLRFARQYDNGWTQTLEPRFFYLYKGYEDQSHIPLFDTAAPDLNFERLFMSERFSGADRIADANQLALGVTSRLLEPGSGRTVLRFDLGRIQSFKDTRVSWPNSTETGFNDQGSDIVAGLHFAPNRNFSAGLIAQYDTEEHDLDRAIARVNYRHDSGFRINLAWRRYNNFRLLPRAAPHYVPGATETLQQVKVGVGFPLTDYVDVYGNWEYSLEYHKDVRLNAGLEYRPSCCWATRLSWQRAIDDDGSYDTAIMFQLVLRGLGAFGKQE